MLTLIADENIIYAREAFSEFGKVHLLPGRAINQQSLQHADVLIVRAVTPVNARILENTPVQFVGTATIGIDHVDLDYLQARNIAFASAAGCNADAVKEYVFTVIARFIAEKKRSFQDLTLGVIGVGNIGSRVARLASRLGMRVLKNDPPLQRQSGSRGFIAIDEVLPQADILTLHVPLTLSGPDKTHHLIDRERLTRLKPGALLINSSRGPVVDNSALLQHLKANPAANTILDVWENEPEIDIELLRHVRLGTPHIAGYSLEGKVNGTRLIYQALCQFLGRQGRWQAEMPPVANSRIVIDGTLSVEQAMLQALSHVYDIRKDDANLRKLLSIPAGERAAYFEHLRKTYRLRRECPNFKVQIQPPNAAITNMLRAFRFSIQK